MRFLIQFLAIAMAAFAGGVFIGIPLGILTATIGLIPFTVKNVNNIAMQFEENYAWHEKRVERICRRAFKSTQRCALNFTQGL